MHDTRVVHGIGQHVARRLCGHQHLAAIGLNQTTVIDQGIDHALIDGHVQQLIARHIQCHRAASSQRHGAELCHDHTLVTHAATQHGHIAPGSTDESLVDNSACPHARKTIVARHKVSIADAERRRDQTTHVHRSIGPKQNTTGVDQKHLAIGRQVTQNL